MTDTPPPEHLTLLDQELEEVRQILREIKEELFALKDRLREDDAAAVKDANRTVTEIRRWLQTAMETEARFEARRKEKEGIANGYALDLDEARHAIGCRLARLRTCHDPGGLSG